MKPFDPRLLRYSRSSRGFLLLAVLLALITTLATIGVAFELSHLVVTVFQHKVGLSTMRPTLIWLFVAFAIKAASALVTQKFATIFSNRMRAELRSAVLAKILSGYMAPLYQRGSASTALLFTRGINDLDGYFTKFLPQLFTASLLPVLVGTTIAMKDLTSGIIVICTVPLIPIFGYMIGRFTGELTTRKLQTLHQLSTYFLDLLEGVTTLKVFGRSKLQSKNIAQVGDRYAAETLAVLKSSFLSSLALELVATLSVALIAVSIGLRLVHGGLGLATGLLVLILAPEVYWPIRQVAARFHDVEDGIVISDQIFSILEAEPWQAAGLPIAEIQAISWSDLTVEYPNRTAICIPAGTVTRGGVHSLVGPSGSGKSTLFALLLGFLAPTSGEIHLRCEAGVKPYRELDLASVRRRIAWLPQEPHLAEGTVLELLGASQAEGEVLLTSVGLPPEQISGGIHAPIGSMNDLLSYGQLRKIALARALHKDADLLLVDEPTASVDHASEVEIGAVLASAASAGKIVFFSTHRAGLSEQSHHEISLVNHS